MSTLRDLLQTIYDDRGELTPEAVVEVAAPKDHPLHSRFEWNDKIAGPLYRRQQASDLIRSVRVRYVETETAQRDVRAFVAIPREDRRSSNYLPVEKAMEDEFTRKIVLRDMEREWKQLKRRYEHMAEFVSMVTEDIAKAS